MEKQIKQISKLFGKDQIIYTGSFALSLMGLTKKAKDLDIIIVNASKETTNILERLHEPFNSDYPKNEHQYRIILEDISVDVWVIDKEIDCLKVGYKDSFINIRPADHIIKAKKKYNRLKDILQLKAIAEMFYKPGDLDRFINFKQRQL